MNGGKTIYLQLKAPTYSIDWEQVKKVINHRTKMIIINTPHNPTGSIMTASDMAKLEKLTKNTEIVIVSDEVYEHIIFDGFEHQSVARFPKLAERSFIISSFGKTFHTTGCKMGYCVAPENLMAEFRKVHQFLVFSVNPQEDVHERFRRFIKKVHHRRIGQKIHARLLINEENRETIGKDRENEPFTMVKYTPKILATPAVVNLHGDKVLIALWTNPPTAFLLESKNAAKSFRNYFELLWGD